MTNPPSPPIQPTLHIVVSCKSRKVVDIPLPLRMSSIAGSRLETRVRDWTRALECENAEPIPAGQLYAGDHWRVVQGIASTPSADIRTKLWIVSAGYGLVEFDTPLKPYSATFVHPHLESVVPTGVSYRAADWWDAISGWMPQPGMMRRISDIARSTVATKGFLLLALSKPYAVALEEDISGAEAIAQDRLGVISAGIAGERSRQDASPSRFGAALLPAEVKLKGVEGMRGAMQGINARIAARASSERAEWFPSRRALAALMNNWLVDAPELPRYERARMSDDEVRAFVVAECSEKVISRSTMLRVLRDSGRACEQSRFAALYVEALAAHNAALMSDPVGAAK